jgi:tetratricopeptide (TPR) repeat protein
MKKLITEIRQLIEQGDQLLVKGDLVAAEEAYQRALAANPRSAEALYSIGCVRSHRRDFQSSAEWAKKALSIDPGHVASRALFGNALFAQERYEEAIAELRSANPDSKDLRIVAQIGLALEKLGKLNEAEETLRGVLEHDTAYVSRGRT